MFLVFFWVIQDNIALSIRVTVSDVFYKMIKMDDIGQLGINLMTNINYGAYYYRMV